MSKKRRKRLKSYKKQVVKWFKQVENWISIGSLMFSFLEILLN